MLESKWTLMNVDGKWIRVAQDENGNWAPFNIERKYIPEEIAENEQKEECPDD